MDEYEAEEKSWVCSGCEENFCQYCGQLSGEFGHVAFPDDYDIGDGDWFCDECLKTDENT
jgi:hypothetical protein